MNLIDNSSVILWDGISSLAGLQKGVYDSTCAWMENLKLAKQLFVHVFPSQTIQTTVSKERPIIAVFSYLFDIQPQTLIIHISPPNSKILFATNEFSFLREYLENRLYTKIALNKNSALEMHQLFITHFRICITNINCMLKEADDWSKITQEKRMNDIIYQYFSVFKEKKNEMMESVRTATMKIGNDIFLTREEKEYAIIVVKCLFGLFYQYKCPELVNPHVVPL